MKGKGIREKCVKNRCIEYPENGNRKWTKTGQKNNTSETQSST